MAAIENGLVTTLQQAVDVLKRFRSPGGPAGPLPLGESWLSEQERRLGADGSADLGR